MASDAGQATTNEGRFPNMVMAICIACTCLWKIPAILISLKRPIEEPIFHPASIFVGLCDFYLIPACAILVTLTFPFQIVELLFAKERIHETLLSPTTLALQMIVFLLLARSWKIRVGRPGDPFNIVPPGAVLPSVIYHRGAWQWVNNLIFGIGQGLLLLIYLWVEGCYPRENLV